MPCVYLPGPAPAVTVANSKYNHYALRRRFWSVKIFFLLFSFFAVNFKQIYTRNKKKKFENKMAYWLKRCC